MCISMTFYWPDYCLKEFKGKIINILAFISDTYESFIGFFLV